MSIREWKISELAAAALWVIPTAILISLILSHGAGEVREQRSDALRRSGARPNSAALVRSVLAFVAQDYYDR